MTEVLRIHPLDNVGIALTALQAGQTVQAGQQTVSVAEDIPAGHKIALQTLATGATVVKYGYPIGHTLCDISVGAWVNEHNIATNLAGVATYSYAPSIVAPRAATDALTFEGYARADGSVGIRNEIWIIPTVGCVNGIAGRLAEMLRSETDGKGVDAIVAFPHNYGCSQLGDDHENTRRVLRDMVLHPNAGGVLVVGLGCENNQISALRTLIGETDDARVKYMECQRTGDELAEGMKLLREIYAVVSTDKRTICPLSALKVGLKCGGSDGFSGITANPLLGLFSDFLIARGGSAVLTEVPEMFGAETLLMNRAASEAIFEQTVKMVNDFKAYFLRNDQPVYENPSPGNKAGGISTLEEKSLGCTQKSGTSVVRGVLAYGEQIKTDGLSLLSAPGNDLVAATALGAAGCQLILFTTGRGTPFGSFVPTVKIASNTPLATLKPQWIDFDAGGIARGESPAELLARLVDYVIAVASGAQVNHERQHNREIAIFKTGVTL
jgi:altronate hydrolase